MGKGKTVLPEALGEMLRTTKGSAQEECSKFPALHNTQFIVDTDHTS